MVSNYPIEDYDISINDFKCLVLSISILICDSMSSLYLKIKDYLINLKNNMN